MNIEFQNLLSSRMQHIDSSAIRRSFDLAAKLSDPINLSIGLPHFKTPPEIIEAIIKATRENKTAYTQTQGIIELREALSKKYLEKNKFKASPENILVSGGIAALLNLLFMATIDKGDKILLTDPAFLIYIGLANFFGAEVDYIPENFNKEDISHFSKKKYKLIIISTPSNPSGYIFSKEQLSLLSNLASNCGGLLVSDEIYELYDYDNIFTSPASLYENTLTLSGFSKSYSMTGLRLGCATGPKEIIKAMIVLQQYSIVCAPTPIQYAGIVALNVDMSKYIEAYKINRDYCIEILSKNNKISFNFPSGAFYVFIKIPHQDQSFIERAINEKKLILVPGYIFSKSKNHIRISYACEKNILEKGLKAFLELI